MLIATDLDGTLVLGNKEGIEELFYLFKKHKFTVVFVTGRDIQNFRKLAKTFYKQHGIKLVYPDYLITLNGTKIYKCRKTSLVPFKKLWLDRKWFKVIKKNWSKRKCYQAFRETAQKIYFNDNIPALVDVKYKPSSYYLESMVYYKKLDQIKETLKEECTKRNTKVNIIFDYLEKHYIDLGLSVLDKIDRNKANIIREMRNEEGGAYVMMPSCSTKGMAVDYLRKKLGLKKNQVIAAGDGGNDYHLLTQGFISIVVKNAHPLLLKKPLKELSEEEQSKIIYTKQEGANGVLEGLNIVLNQSLTHSSDSSLSSVINA